MPLSAQNSTEVQSFTSDTYLVKLLEGINHLRFQNTLCDVSLEADGVVFPAHKVILASASSYCKMLFTGNAASTGDPESTIRVKDVSATGLKTIMNFIYSNTLDLSLLNIEDTLKAAEILLVREAIKLCFKYLEECLNHQNCLTLLNITRKHGPEELKQKAMSYVGQHYKQIFSNAQLLKDLDRDTLCEILENNNISEYSELELFRFAKTWLQHDNARHNKASDIFKRIRFPLIPLEDLQRDVQEMPIMKTNATCFGYLQEALKYHAQLYAQPTIQSKNSTIRSSSEKLLVLGGRTNNNKICGSIWISDQGCSTWGKLGELCTPVYNHCVAVINNFLFVIGGQKRFDPSGKYPSNEVFRFDPRNGSWLQVARMLERRTRFHADVISERIIVVGGGTLLGGLTQTVEEYSPTENKWEFTAPFPMAVADHAGSNYKGILYISGGFTAGKTINDLNTYLPRLRRWVSNRAMTFARCDHGMATIGEKIFCIGGRTFNSTEGWSHVNETEYYCPASDQWSTLKISPFACCQFSVISLQSKLYIMGGGKLRDMNKENGVFTYDHASNVWEKAGSLPKPLVDHVSCTLKLSHQLQMKVQNKAWH
ncbi:kelch-like protein 9 isoform X2 [Microcaecilia unicolor]|uniref:Kelch-like protein 9 isoform X2 n=1 Tax=Microcaecilia unicolor TaxID=1415580 RepID=A0A6P7YDB0_9AMPH|nr:kelch-like protein 9 isoform X2 [Microcaecilia unicolor]